MAYTKVFTLAAMFVGMSLAAPQSLVRLIPADLALNPGLRAIPAETIESHAVHAVHQDGPLITRFAQLDHPLETRLVQAPLVTRLVQGGPAFARVVPANPAVTTVVQAAPAPVRTIVEEVQTEVSDPNPQYNFGYSVADTLTGDSKSREEKRDGDVVTGSYTIADPDGRIRHVTYTADAVNGFQAKVTYDGEEGPVAIPVEGGSVQTVAIPQKDENDDTVSIINARKKAVVAATAAPTIVRAVPQPIGPATLIAAPQPQLIQIGGDDQAALVRNFDGHALHQVAPAQHPQIIRLANDQTFEVTPFGLREISLGNQLSQPLILRASPNGHFIQA